MPTEHIHAVCQLDAPLDAVVSIMSGAMAHELRMTPRIINLTSPDSPSLDRLEWQRKYLEELMTDSGVGAISFAFSPRGDLEKVDFKELVVRRAESVETPLLTVAYCTTLWTVDTVALLDDVVPAAGDAVRYIAAVVASFDPDAEHARPLEPTPVPLMLISKTAGVRVGSTREFAQVCRRVMQPKSGADNNHLSESFVERLTLREQHGLTQPIWSASMAHLMSCDMCGEKSRYYALNSPFLTGSIPA